MWRLIARNFTERSLLNLMSELSYQGTNYLVLPCNRMQKYHAIQQVVLFRALRELDNKVAHNVASVIAFREAVG